MAYSILWWNDGCASTVPFEFRRRTKKNRIYKCETSRRYAICIAWFIVGISAIRNRCESIDELVKVIAISEGERRLHRNFDRNSIQIWFIWILRKEVWNSMNGENGPRTRDSHKALRWHECGVRCTCLIPSYIESWAFFLWIARALHTLLRYDGYLSRQRGDRYRHA